MKSIRHALLLVAPLLVESALGHGGMYTGPTPTLPPGAGPGNGGPGTAGPGGGVPGGPPAGGPVTGGGRVRKRTAPSYTDWATWWRMNKHPYLNLRARLGSLSGVTGVGREGVDASKAVFESPRPSFEELEGSAIPVLRRLLREDDPDIVDSAVLALARITPAEQADAVREDIVRTLQSEHRSVRQSALLALGVLGDRKAAPLLLDIVHDRPAGREALGLRQDVDEVLRAFAAVALGYLSVPEAVEPVRELADRSDDADVDLRAGSYLALGLFGSGQYDIVPFLLDGLDDERMPELVQAQIPIAIARLGDAARPLVSELLSLATGRRTRNMVRQSCVVALGRLAAPEDVEVVDALFDLAQKANDEPTRNFAFIALGEIGARAAADGRHEELVREITRTTLTNVVRPRKKTNLPWAATASALVARALPAEHALRETVSDRLYREWKQTGNPDRRAALAIALGLIEAREHGDVLLDELEDTGNREEAGTLAEALGLMRYEEARPVLKQLLDGERDVDYRVQLATGLGLMGDVEVSPLLTTELADATTLAETAAIAKALGNVGDRSAVVPLMKIAQDRDRPGLARGFACVALGLIGEKTPLPWNTRVTAGSNYLAAFYTQSEILDIL